VYKQDVLGAARSGGSSPGRGKTFVFFAERLRLLWGPPSLLFKGYLGYLPGKSGRCVKYINQLDLALKFRISGAIHLLLLYVFMVWTGRTLFTFTSKC